MSQKRQDSAGLLIVNADDLGGHQLATDRTLACFQRGVITSATAMVFMADSARAAELARATELPVGLHLNLTQRFDAPGIPPPIAARQARVVGYMADLRRRRFGFAPQLIGTIRAVLDDQLERFRELYATEPTHLDSHNHVHLNPSVLPLLPRRFAVRPGYDRASTSTPAKLLRRARNGALRRRHRSVDHYFALSALDPVRRGGELRQALALARLSSVEVMAHPAEDREFELLTANEWREQLAQCRLGSYADLAVHD